MPSDETTANALECFAETVDQKRNDLIIDLDSLLVDAFYEKHFAGCWEAAKKMGKPWLDLYKLIGVKSLEEYDRLIDSKIDSDLVSHAVTKVLEAEKKWDEFLKNVVDVKLNAELGNLSNNVTSLGTSLGGRKWFEQSKLNIPVFMDQSGQFINFFKFPISVWNTFRTWYFKKNVIPFVIAGFCPVFDDPLHDIHQMGGDILFDNKGEVLYLHRTETSADRPSVDEILAGFV